MRGTVVSAFVALLAAAASGAPLFLDAAALRSEVASRRAVYGTAPAGTWAPQARALDRVLLALDTSSRSLGEDLEVVAVAARLLDVGFGEDAVLRDRIAAVLDEAESLVDWTRWNGEQAAYSAPPGRSSRRADALLEGAGRCLDRSRDAASPGIRARLLRRAIEKVELARVSLGMGPASATAAADVAIGGASYGPSVFAPNAGGAVVELDENGVPTGLLLRFRRAAPGGPASALLEIRVDGTFTGVGDYPTPALAYNHDGSVFLAWALPAGPLQPVMEANVLTITSFDWGSGRLEGTFQLRTITNAYRLDVLLSSGTFIVEGALFRGP